MKLLLYGIMQRLDFFDGMGCPFTGVDLEADMMVKTILEEKKQYWIFQCKHMKAQIDRIKKNQSIKYWAKGSWKFC